MTGTQYWQMKRRMTTKELAERSGCSVATILQLTQKQSAGVSSATVSRVANALGVTMDELLREYHEDALEDGDHSACRTWGQAGGNALNRYRLDHNLTYMELARYLNMKSRQHVERACKSEKVSGRYVRRLCESTGMTAEKFYQAYGKGGAANG